MVENKEHVEGQKLILKRSMIAFFFYSSQLTPTQILHNGLSKSHYLFFFVFIFFSNPVFAQIDSIYIATTTQTKNISFQSISRDFVLGFQIPKEQKPFFRNSNLSLRVRVAFKKLSTSIAIPVARYRSNAFGRPRSFLFNFDFYPSSFYIHTSFRYIRMNGEKVITKRFIKNILERAGRLIFSDNTGYYLFNASQFSLSSALHMTHRQIKSAGSAFVYIPLRYQYFLKEEGATQYPDYWTLDNHQSIRLGLGTGYTYSRVRGHWTATGLIGAGLAYQKIKYQIINDSEFLRKGYLQADLRLMGSIVHNKERFFYGLTTDYFPNFEHKTDFGPHIRNWSVKANLGWRFD